MSFSRTVFVMLRNMLAIFGLLCLVGGGVAALYILKSLNLPPRVIAQKSLEKTGLDMPFLVAMVTPDPVKPDKVRLPPLDAPDWAGQGSRADQKLAPFHYTRDGRPIPGIWLSQDQQGSHILPRAVRVVPVSSAEALLGAIQEALPGDAITIAPGTYRLDRRTINAGRPGRPDAPIFIRAEQLGQVRLELNTLEGFLVHAPFWVFENLDIQGVCPESGNCEHAFHVVGQGRGFVLRNSRVREFNAMIKANGLGPDDQRVFPDNALIEGNSFFNSSVRQTRSPVAFLDIVGADNWIIRGNFIANNAKGHGDQVSTGAFIKGNASGGVFENNLVICEYSHSGGTRIGLSFGGGGTGRAAARDHDVSVEHTGGIVRNNIVMYCSDVGLYLNKARETQVLNNTFFRTMGIDVRFPESTAMIANNILDGKIRDRDGGFSIREHNLVLAGGLLGKGFEDVFQNPWVGDFLVRDGQVLAGKGLASEEVKRDFCDRPRPEAPSIGAVEVQAEGECWPLGMR